ncbi:D-glycero-beta-D-manno-heptose 1-phosphate adenylyltransferase [Candidatus Marinamargulisbacteria bacterium SCGC AG-410-N11]|nr:D-glycero-beta-D-manno-heptose 1-phosphate adenylyltransferase [Candidatus Marinamargulisbacteria bacterium SCGC AG-410-N11]
MKYKKLLSLNDLNQVTRTLKLKSSSNKIVFTNGCFDIIHAGHVQYLEDAKQLGDILIVAVNSDESIQRIKGTSRPIICQEHRISVLNALNMIDYLIMFDTDTPIPIIESIQPDIHVKGGDYTEDELPESTIIREYGGSIKILPLVPDLSTSKIIEKIIKISQ